MTDDALAAKKAEIQEMPDRQLLEHTCELVYKLDGRCEERGRTCPGIMAAQANGLTLRLGSRALRGALAILIPALLAILGVKGYEALAANGRTAQPRPPAPLEAPK